MKNPSELQPIFCNVELVNNSIHSIELYPSLRDALSAKEYDNLIKLSEVENHVFKTIVL